MSLSIRLHTLNVPSIADVVNFYFQGNAIEMACDELAVIAATFANDGVNPVTDTTALPADVVKSVLPRLYACGMNRFTGTWMVSVPGAMVLVSSVNNCEPTHIPILFSWNAV